MSFCMLVLFCGSDIWFTMVMFSWFYCILTFLVYIFLLNISLINPYSSKELLYVGHVLWQWHGMVQNGHVLIVLLYLTFSVFLCLTFSLRMTMKQLINQLYASCDNELLAYCCISHKYQSRLVSTYMYIQSNLCFYCWSFNVIILILISLVLALDSSKFSHLILSF